MINVKDALEALLKSKKLDVKIKEHALVEIWNDNLSKKFPIRSRAISCKNGKLFVCVEDSVWAQELTLIKKHIVEEINRLSNDKKISDLRIFVGKIDDKSDAKEQESVKSNIGNDVYKPENSINDFEIIEDNESSMFINRRNINQFPQVKETLSCLICDNPVGHEKQICKACDFIGESDIVLEMSAYIYEQPSMSFIEAEKHVKGVNKREFAVARFKVRKYKEKAVLELKTVEDPELKSGKAKKLIRELELLTD